MNIIKQSTMVQLINDYLYDTYRNYHRCELDYDSFLDTYLYFITVGVKPLLIDGKPPVESALFAFKKVHMDFCSQYIKNYKRKHGLLPRTFVCYDIPGSRYGAGIDLNPTYPHLHGLMLIHPDTYSDFQRALPNIGPNITTYNSSRITSFAIERFDKQKRSLYDLITYITKAYNVHQYYNGRYASIYYDLFPQ